MSLVANPCLVAGSVCSILLLLPSTHAHSIPSDTVKTSGSARIINDGPWSKEVMQSVHHTLSSAGRTVPQWKSTEKATKTDRGAPNNAFADMITDSNDMYI